MINVSTEEGLSMWICGMYVKEGRRKADVVVDDADERAGGFLPGVGASAEFEGGKDEFVIKTLWYGYIRTTCLVS